jgi:hypothetical protein
MKFRTVRGVFLAVMLLALGTAVQADDLVRSEIIEVRAGKNTHFVGFLLEMEQTVAPTQMIVRQMVSNEGTDHKDWIVKIDQDTIIAKRGDRLSNLEYFMIGDQIVVTGTKTNTDTVLAAVVLDHSISGAAGWSTNGFITEKACHANQVTVDWKGQKIRIDFSNNANIIIPPEKNKTCDDLQVGDRVRGRGIWNPAIPALYANQMIVLRRGAIKYVAKRADHLGGVLIRRPGTEVPTTFEVRDEKAAGKPTYVISVTEQSHLFNRRGGQGYLVDWIEGDQIDMLVKKSEGDTTTNTYELIVGRNTSYGLVTTDGVEGTITAKDTASNSFTLLYKGKNYRIDVSDKTKIVVNGVSGKTYNDLKVGMVGRGRGTKHRGLNIITAETIVAWNGQTPKSVTPSAENYRENFDDGEAQNWAAVNGTWSVTNQTYQGTGGGHTYTFYNEKQFDDFTYQADVRVDSGYNHPAITFRSQDVNNHYILRVNQWSSRDWDSLQLFKKVNPNLSTTTPRDIGWEQLGGIRFNEITSGDSMKIGAWYTMKVEAIGSQIKAKIWEVGTTEPDWQITVTDTTFTQGKIGLERFSGAHSFDNLQLTVSP